MYGVFNPQADSQGVVVFPIADELAPLPAEPLGARVYSTDLVTNETIEWSDSIRSDDQGAVHVYWAPFTAEYDRSYTLRIESEDLSESSEVTVHVPPQADVVPSEPEIDIWVTQNVNITAPVARLNFLLVRYVIKARLPPSSLPYPVLLPDRQAGLGDPPPNPDPVAPPPPEDSLVVQRLFVPIDYSSQAALDAGGWTIPINFSFDFREIRQRVSRRGNHDAAYGIRLEAIEISLVAANAEWEAPDGRYEADVLIQPGTMSNIQNGFGFVGAGYRLRHSYILSDEILTRIGFRLDQ